jgi:biotin---protein ligase
MFSTVLRHPLVLTQSAPVVFIQYLLGLAIVQGIQTYEPGYDKIPVKLKWPNDIYALTPKVDSSGAQKFTSKSNGTDVTSDQEYVKIGGILVNSSYSGSEYTLVAGAGINLSNAAPTTSLNALAAACSPAIPDFQMEKLLARILTCFESIYSNFKREGWSRSLEDIYYRNWLHR